MFFVHNFLQNEGYAITIVLCKKEFLRPSVGFLGRDKSGKGIGLESDKDYHKPAPGTIASGDDS